MQNVLAGQTLTTTLLNNWTPLAQTATCTPAANFTVSSFTVFKTAGVTHFAVQLSYSGATITASSAGNITDTACCTLPFAPPANMWLAYQVAATSDGVVGVDTSGICTLLTLSPTGTIMSGQLVGFSGVILTG